jgi:hypothetical protein
MALAKFAEGPQGRRRSVLGVLLQSLERVFERRSLREVDMRAESGRIIGRRPSVIEIEMSGERPRQI